MCAIDRAGYLLAMSQGGCGFSDRGQTQLPTFAYHILKILTKEARILGQDFGLFKAGVQLCMLCSDSMSMHQSSSMFLTLLF